MDIEVLRPDQAYVHDGTLTPGLYLISDDVDRSDLPAINHLQPLENGVYIDSSDGLQKYIPALNDIAGRGDLIVVFSNGVRLRTYLTRNTHQNTILVTEACENLCVFCSQPPKDSYHQFDSAWLALQHFNDDSIVGITGGEPTLYWAEFIEFCIRVSSASVKNSFHILSHGRKFASQERVQELVQTGFLSRTLWGIPVHGHRSMLHDQATRREGSFAETLDGLINMAYAGAAIEVRVIVTKQNVRHLPEIAELLASYLSGANFFVAFMSLEPVGWARANFDLISVTSEDFIEPMELAIELLALHAIECRLYNFPHCHLSNKLRPHAEKSISDWKNYYLKECGECTARASCCGFFSSATGRRISNARPIL